LKFNWLGLIDEYFQVRSWWPVH